MWETGLFNQFRHRWVLRDIVFPVSPDDFGWGYFPKAMHDFIGVGEPPGGLGPSAEAVFGKYLSVSIRVLYRDLWEVLSSRVRDLHNERG